MKSTKETSMNETSPPPRMQTYSGRLVDPLNILPSEIVIDDIAHGLALTIRYGGQSRFPLSVAQHSLMVADILPSELRLWGLLHDSAEAYLGDVIHPLKVHLKTYHLAESVLMERIAGVFGMCWPEPPEIRAADLAIGATECAQFGIPVNERREAKPVEGLIISEMSWRVAENNFLHEFKKLGENLG